MAISVGHGGINLKVKYILTKRMEKKNIYADTNEVS